MKSKLIAATIFATATIVNVASAGFIAEENKKAGLPGGWAVNKDGTAKGTGEVDVYPGRWSIKTGDPIRLKISSSTGYDVRVMRVGWYDGKGATEVAVIPRSSYTRAVIVCAPAGIDAHAYCHGADVVVPISDATPAVVR